MKPTPILFLLALALMGQGGERAALSNPRAPEMNRRAPETYQVRLDTSQGAVVIEVHRDWAPLGADRFYNLVGHGFYDEARFFRVIAGAWAQFGMPGRPDHRARSGGRRGSATTRCARGTTAALSPTPWPARTTGRRRSTST